MIYDRYGGQYNGAARVVEAPSIETAALRGRSSYLLNALGSRLLPGCTAATEQAWAPGIRQPLPTTAADLIKALGATGVILPANVLAIYLCDTASPLVDTLGLGPNLVAAGGPLTGRECVGLGDTTFASKVGVEVTNSLNRFDSGATAFGDVAAGTIRSFLLVWRVNSNQPALTDLRLLAKETGFTNTRWIFLCGQSNQQMYIQTTLSAGFYCTIAASINDASWLCTAICLNGITNNAQIFSSVGDSAPGAYLGAIQDPAVSFSLGSAGGINSSSSQVAYLACFDVALTSAQRAAFWRHAQSAGLGTPNSYAHASPLVVPISASRVACYGADQLAVGYDANLASAARGNALGTGLVCEESISFMPIGSTDLYTNANPSGAATKASVDGPSGMRDGVRITTAAAWNAAGSYLLLPSASFGIAGVSNVPWRADASYRRATLGTSARIGMYFSGDPGGAEFFNLFSDAATPADWTRNGGTCTPTRAAQTNGYVFLGCTNNNENCDFGEVALVRNRTTAPLAWRRVGTAAAAIINTPALSVVNPAGNTRYSPIRGEHRIKFAGFQGPDGATILQFGAAAAAGSLTLDRAGGSIRLRIWDGAGALAATVMGGPIGTGYYDLAVLWDSRAPLPGITGAYAALVQLNTAPSPTLLGWWPTPWTPATANVTPLYIGTDAAIGNAARCLIQEA